MERNEGRYSFLDFVPSFCFARTSYFKIKIMIGPLEDWEKLMASPVAILGGGVSGRGVSALLQRLGWKFRVYDELGIKLTPAKLRSSALVVVSPGFRPDHPWLLLARQMKIRVLGELDFASCFTASPITAITGTNGKTTVATLLHHALSKLGHVTSTCRKYRPASFSIRCGTGECKGQNPFGGEFFSITQHFLPNSRSRNLD
jgi:hypothetical protein